jgi:hypothetical protein
MRNHLYALLVKYAVTGSTLLLLSYLNLYPLSQSLVLAILVVILSYVIGDLLILRMANNTVSTIADLGLTTLAIWILGPYVLGSTIPFTHALIASAIISAAEWFLHKYIAIYIVKKSI